MVDVERKRRERESASVFNSVLSSVWKLWGAIMITHELSPCVPSDILSFYLFFSLYSSFVLSKPLFSFWFDLITFLTAKRHIIIHPWNDSQVRHAGCCHIASPHACRYKNLHATRRWVWYQVCSFWVCSFCVIRWYRFVASAFTLDAEATNLYQRMTGSILHCSLLRPDLMYYASQLRKVMSRPIAAHMGLTRKVLQYPHGTCDNVITYRPTGCDGFEERDCSFLSFSDADLACAIDTNRSHGSHVLMLGGGAISWRSRSHKSVMLSTAVKVAEY